MANIAQKDVKVTVPSLHAPQRQVKAERKRFNVVDCGRRWGKTLFGCDLVIDGMLDGEPWGWFAPGYKYLLEPWMDLKRFMAPVTKRANEVDKRIDLITGGYVEMWSADSPDAGRSRGYKGIIVDEAAMVRQLKRLFMESLRPALADHRGECWFLSTPKGPDDFKDFYDMGMNPDEPEWAAWMMPTATNPFIHPDEIAAAKRLMPPRSFDQEFMAQFLDTAAGGLFDPEKWRYCSEAPHLAEWIRYWDLAVEVKKENDHTSGAMVGLGADGTIYINRPPTFWQEPWPVSRSMIKQITDDDRKWVEGYGGLYRPAVEKAGQQKGFIDDLNWGERVYFYPEGVKGDKKERCAIWAWRQCASKVCLVGEPVEWQGFIGRCHVFTGKGEEQDDDIDAVSGAVGLLYKSKGEVVQNEKVIPYGSTAWHIANAKRVSRAY